MQTLINTLQENPSAALIAVVALLLSILPVVVGATWYVGRKLKDIEFQISSTRLHLNGRIDAVDQRLEDHKKEGFSRHQELKNTITTRIDDLKHTMLSLLPGGGGDD